jgi:hypothetical protein
MNEIATSENPVIAPRLHEIFDALRRRGEVRRRLEHYSASDYRPNSGAVGAEIASVIGDLASQERCMLRGLVDLKDDVERAIQLSGTLSNATNLMRAFRAFEISKIILNPEGRLLDHHYAVISRRSDTGIADPITEIIGTVTIDGRRWRQFEVALDLLQYWELLLRNQTDLKCSEFSEATRKVLLGRVTRTVFGDGIFRRLDAQLGSPTPSSNMKAAPIVQADIARRLDGVSLHLAEVEIRRNELKNFSARDLDCSSSSHQSLKRAERLYHDELTHLLSELVHLCDNLKKWLKVNRRSRHALCIVENMRAYRVASCYVNTSKHGVRGRNKTSALADIAPTVLVGDAKAQTANDQILDSMLTINYEGEPWAASELVDDLVQLWELFLRNHTTVDTSNFRVEIGKRLLAQQKLSTYTLPLPEETKAYLKSLSDERRTLDI